MAQPPPVPLLPQLEERRRQQRERAGRALDVRHERVDELGLDAEADALAGGSMAWRSSSRCIEVTSTWFAASSDNSSGYAAQRS